MLLTKEIETRVILPSDATARERFAAEELSNYLKLSLEIETQSADHISDKANNIIIGGPGRNAVCAQYVDSHSFSSLVPGAEGMYIEISQNAVIIAGSEGDFDDRQRGTVYGVYEFLERYLGCSFAAYSDPAVCAGEMIPKYESIQLEDGCYIKEGADRPYRAAIVQYGEAAGDPYHRLNLPFIDWMCKNRYNRILTWVSVYEAYKKTGLCEELEKRGIRMSVGHHESSRMWLPYFGNEYFHEHYAQTHPEYYRLNADGTRYRPQSEGDHTGQWIYCSRNQGCIAQVAENLIRWIGQNPIVDIIAFWPNDGIWEQCSCEKCTPYSKVENYTYFQNEVAKRVSAVYPNVKMDMLVYVDLWEYPKGVTLQGSLLIDEATWAADGQRRCGKPDGSCLSKTAFEDNLLAWRDAGADVVYYDYYMGVFPGRQRIIPMADEVQSIWKRFSQVGISGSGTQIECFNIWNNLFNLYTFGRTAYDSSLSMEDNLKAMASLYGEGGAYVAEAIRLMEKTLDGQEVIGHAGAYMIRHIDRELVYGLFDKALAVTADKTARNNIRLSRMAFRYTDLEVFDSATATREAYSRFQTYEDPTGELAYMASHFDSFTHNDPGYGIAIPVANTDSDFVPDQWYLFE